MASRRYTGSPNMVSVGPSRSNMSAPEDTEKELSNVLFNPIEYGSYKHSIDHAGINIISPISTVGQSTNAGRTGTNSLIRPSDCPEAITHREELPGHHFPETDVDRGDIVAEPRRIWGMRKKWVWVAVGGVGLIIIALVAGLTGGLLRPKAKPTGTNMAAVNWVVGNVTYHAIFTQPESDGSLIAYVKTEASWTTIDISDVFSDTVLPIRAASPLAAVAMYDPADSQNPEVNQLRVYFTTSANSVVEIITHDPELRSWSWGILGPHMNHTLEIAETSQLAATWRQCRNETSCGRGQFFLVYESSRNTLMVANSTANWDPSVAVDRIDSPSGIALMSVQALDFRNDSDYAWAIYKDAGRVATGWEDYAHDWEWTDTSQEITGMPPPEDSNLQTLAAASFRDRTHTLLVGLGDADGTIYGNHWDPEPYVWVGARPLNLQGGAAATDFSTIAMTADAWLYAISAGKIQEYEMDASDPYTFYLKGEVA